LPEFNDALVKKVTTFINEKDSVCIIDRINKDISQLNTEMDGLKTT
jgi:hypothetical protein